MDNDQNAPASDGRVLGSLAEMVGAYGDRLLRSACLLCGDPDEAQDLVQETFLQAHHSSQRFAGRSSVYTWLHGILLNLSRHHHRRRQRLVYDDQLAAQERVFPDEISAPSDLAAVSAALGLALRQLSEPHREVLVLRYYETMKIHEIARQLGISPGTVKSRLHYALMEMQKLLPDEMNLFGPGGTVKKETI